MKIKWERERGQGGGEEGRDGTRRHFGVISSTGGLENSPISALLMHKNY